MNEEGKKLVAAVCDAIEEYAICQARAIIIGHESVCHTDTYSRYNDEHNRVRGAGAKDDLRLRIAEIVARAGEGAVTLTGPVPIIESDKPGKAHKHTDVALRLSDGKRKP